MIKKRHGFRVVSEKVDYKNPFMQVIRQEVIRPDGKQKPYWMLDRRGDFSLIIPIYPDNTTVMVGQYRVPTGKYLWEFPMGMVAGASPLTAAKEELRQETGLRATSWKKIGYFYVAAGFSGQRAHIYMATGLSEGKADPEEDEYIDTKRVPLRELKRMIKDGSFTDGPSIIAFHLLQEKMEVKV